MPVVSDEVVRSLQERVRTAVAARTSLVIRAGGTKDFYGNSARTEHDVLDPRAYCGVIDYEPTELVITACSGTSLTEVEATLAQHNQMLAFEPPHFGALPTLGGAIASGLAGPRRMASGSVRDFVLGATLMDGHANVLTFGGNVMKNVAGYDVSRALAGSLGTLGMILDVSLKVVPRPATRANAALRSCRKPTRYVAPTNGPDSPCRSPPPRGSTARFRCGCPEQTPECVLRK